MKTILASVISAVVAGLVLFFAQNWWSENQNAAKQSVRFDEVASLDLTKSQLLDLSKKANDYQNTTISMYKSKNVGK